jgi:hypothetical protein
MTGNERARQALLAIGAIPAGSAGSALSIRDALIIGNQMLDSWAVERLTIYETRRELFALVAGTPSYTIGVGGTFNRARPVWVERAGVVSNPAVANEMELPLHVVRAADEWANLEQKNLSSTLPDGIYPDGGFPLRTVWIYPIPSVGGLQLALYLPTAITALAPTGVDYTFPPGYEEAINYNWALRLCVPFGRVASNDLKEFARTSLGRIKRVNETSLDITLDPALTRGGTGSKANIQTGDYR